MNRQTIQRLWHSFRLIMIPGSGRRADYLRDHGVFRYIGKNCTIVERKVPLYPRLISLGNNVHLAAKVLLVPHDAIHLCLNNWEKESGGEMRYKEKLGCIEIGDNVFVGANTTVLYNVRIGSNVIIGAGSLVNKDIPDNSVAVGTPARVIGTFEDFAAKRKADTLYPDDLAPHGHALSKALEEWCWSSWTKNR